MKHTFSITVEIDPSWVEYLTKYHDIFGTACGYWLRGCEHKPELGWLCWEDDEKHSMHGDEPDRVAAYRAWIHGKPLPPHWFRLDEAAALRAWEEGVKRWGENWYEDVDSIREDVVVQLALLGEVKYG